MTGKKLFVVIPMKDEWKADKLLARIVEILNAKKLDWHLLLVVSNSKPKFYSWISEVASVLADTPQTKTDQFGKYAITKHGRISILEGGDLKKHGLTFAYDYLSGFQYAIQQGADWIVETDAGGSFSPEDLPRFLVLLESGSHVFSTRFNKELGAANKYPPLRVAVSFIGTVLGNAFLGLGRVVTDLTSGYEAFQAGPLKRVFDRVPIEQWISVTTVAHFIQTELRTYLLWQHRHEPEAIEELAIVMGDGLEETPPNLKLATVLKSFKCLLQLKKRRGLFVERHL